MDWTLSRKIWMGASRLLILGFLLVLLLPTSTLAQTNNNQAAPLTTKQRCDAYKNQFTITSTTNSNVQTSIIGDAPVFCSASDLALAVINYALVISGTVTILFLIVGGFFYLTSAGNEEQSEKGKKILMNAVMGLIVIILSAAIVRIISSTLTLGK